MAQLLGREGQMKVGTNAVAEIRDWSVTITAGAIDANTMQSGEWLKSVSGRKGWTGEVNCFYDASDTDGQLAFEVGTEVTVEFLAEGDTTGNESRTGTARVSEISISGSGENDAFFEFTASLTGVGAITTGTVA